MWIVLLLFQLSNASLGACWWKSSTAVVQQAEKALKSTVRSVSVAHVVRAVVKICFMVSYLILASLWLTCTVYHMWSLTKVYSKVKMPRSTIAFHCGRWHVLFIWCCLLLAYASFLIKQTKLLGNMVRRWCEALFALLQLILCTQGECSARKGDVFFRRVQQASWRMKDALK